MIEKMNEMRKKWAEGDAKRDAGVVDPENIVRHTDLPYGPHMENLLDVYYPEGTDRPLPTIISIPTIMAMLEPILPMPTSRDILPSTEARR